MARLPTRPGTKTLRMSVLDRLLLGSGPDPDGRVAQARRLRESVRRDLEALFNTRTVCHSWPRSLGELSHSLLSYGLPDLQARTVSSSRHREQLRVEVETTIRRFEPRLHQPVVEFISSSDALDRSLRFRIHGQLIVDTGGEAVVYDTQIDPASREIKIAAAERDRESGEAP